MQNEKSIYNYLMTFQGQWKLNTLNICLVGPTSYNLDGPSTLKLRIQSNLAPYLAVDQNILKIEFN